MTVENSRIRELFPEWVEINSGENTHWMDLLFIVVVSVFTLCAALSALCLLVIHNEHDQLLGPMHAEGQDQLDVGCFRGA